MPESSPANFASFYRATLGPLRRYLAVVVGNRTEAQDLAHDAYARVYKAMATQPVTQPRAFLFTTAYRLAITQIRRRLASPVRAIDDKLIELMPAVRPAVEQMVMAREEWARFEHAVAGLPAGCRTVLVLCNSGDFTHAEIGRKLGIAVSTVEKQHARALRLLRSVLHDDAGMNNDGRAEPRGSAAGR